MKMFSLMHVPPKVSVQNEPPIQPAFLVKPCSNLEHVHRNTWKILTRKVVSFVQSPTLLVINYEHSLSIICNYNILLLE